MNIYAIILHPDVHELLLTSFRGYLIDIEPSPFLASLSFEQNGNFVSLDLIKNTNDKEPWKVKIPTQYILYSAELGEEKQRNFGFLS